MRFRSYVLFCVIASYSVAYDYESDNATTYAPDYESYDGSSSSTPNGSSEYDYESYDRGYHGSHTAHFERLRLEELEYECEGKVFCPDVTEWCLEESDICDGYDDCSDGSDEPPMRNVNNNNSNVTFCRWSSGFICALPDEWRIPGAEKYNCNKSWECQDDEFACRDGSRCIPVTKFCDGCKDCPDASDEPPLRNMSNDVEDFRICRGKGYRSWTCVLPDALIQDKEKICREEWGCGDWLTCLDGSRCIQERDYCDGFTDCADKSDEPPLCKVNFRKTRRLALSAGRGDDGSSHEVEDV